MTEERSECRKILSALYVLQDELIELYKQNGGQAFDAGRIDGVKQSIELIERGVK